MRIKSIQYPLFTILLISIFFPVKYIVNDQYRDLLGYNSDFMTIFLYLSDILLIIGLILEIIVLKKRFKNLPYLWIFLIIIPYLSHVFFKGINQPLSIYYTFTLLLGLVAYETMKNIVTTREFSIRYFAKVFIVICFIQSLISIQQFKTQASVGLFHVGESRISRGIQGVAKVDIPRGKVIRAYGTFPHPNTLSVFLLTGWLLSLVIYIKEKKIPNFWLIMGIFISTGLFLTFSRATLIAYFITTISLISYTVWSKFHLKQILTYVISSLIVLSSLVINYSNIIFSRISNQDQSLNSRISYIQAGKLLIQQHPLLGVGPGQALFQMKQRNLFADQPWLLQPIHNYFLLLWSELGILALLTFIILVLYIIQSSLKKFRFSNNEDRFYIFTYLLLLFIFLILMFADHYFYTQRQTIILLWVTLGYSNYFLHKKTNV